MFKMLKYDTKQITLNGEKKYFVNNFTINTSQCYRYDIHDNFP